MEEEKVFPGKRSSPLLGKVADDVWLLRGDIKSGMNVYFIRDGDGVVQFDAGTEPMTEAVKEVGERLGGIKKVVLGHVDSDHRGTAPHIDAPIFCHPDEVEDAKAPGPYRPYWDLSKIDAAWVRMAYRYFHRRWDAGACELAGTVEEGDEVAGFKVIHFPGHAPGLIGLFRESDRLAIVSDTVYLVDAQRLKALPEGEATVPIDAYNWDTGAARDSLQKLVDLNPATVAPGHEHPVSENLGPMLQSAVDACNP
jgi:hydroxyacylglutathione hydrolase